MLKLLQQVVKGPDRDALAARLDAARAAAAEAHEAADRVAAAHAVGQATDRELARAVKEADRADERVRLAERSLRGAERAQADAQAAEAAAHEEARWGETAKHLDAAVAIGGKLERLFGEAAVLLGALYEHGVWVQGAAPLPAGVRESFARHRLERIVADFARVHRGIGFAGDASATDSPRTTPELVKHLEELRAAIMRRRVGAEPEPEA